MRRNASRSGLKHASENRKAMPKAELLLWSRMRTWRTAGIVVRRQHVIGPYIADFAVVKARLIIECDGMSHDYQVDADAQRERFLESQGWRVIRFANTAILSDPDGIADALYSIVVERLKRG
ncbi:MAG: hypothetical protein AMXMBFR81_28990 [Chthonomonas sp.]